MLRVVSLLLLSAQAAAFSVAPLLPGDNRALGNGRTSASGFCRTSNGPLGLRAQERVLVTGASGRTGRLIFQKLAEADWCQVKGLVRSDNAVAKLEKIAKGVEIAVGDILDKESLKAAMHGCHSLIVVTSAVPKLKKREIFKLLLFKMIGRTRTPRFYYDEMPEQVDWMGLKNQVDVAKELGLKFVVVVGSMGVSPKRNTPDAFLNRMGDGNILVWKAKGETYLAESGLPYCIVHAGGLTDGPEGLRELVFGVCDDHDVYAEMGATKFVTRADVSIAAIEALRHKDAAAGVQFDIISKDPVEGQPAKEVDWAGVFLNLKLNVPADK